MSGTPTISGSTRIMAVIGDPIRQARSPGAFNQIFAEKDADIVCIPLQTPSADLKTAWAALKAMPNFIGFGITIPHKRAALELCDSLDPTAERIGAVNLVRRELDGSFRGYQFDGLGFVGGLRARGIEPRGRNCLMIGAGGAGTAVAFALADAGIAELAILNRSAGKAQALAESVNRAVGRQLARTGAMVINGEMLVINATSLGLREDDPLPVSPEGLGPGVIVADLIAQPEHTRLLILAKAQGAKVHSGTHTIRAQAPLIADYICELWHQFDGRALK